MSSGHPLSGIFIDLRGGHRLKSPGGIQSACGKPGEFANAAGRLVTMTCTDCSMRPYSSGCFSNFINDLPPSRNVRYFVETV